MKVGKVNLSSLHSSSFRFDPSLHLSEGVKVRHALNSLPYGLSSVANCSNNVFLGNIFTRTFVKNKEYGLTYLAASDTVLSNIETGRFLSKKQVQKLSHLMLDKDWILCTCSGTLGNVTYTNSTFCDKIATHDLIRIIPDDSKYKKGCLYAFLAGKFGYFQITQSQFVKHINAEQAGTIHVPNFPSDFQDKIDASIRESSILRENASDALFEAISAVEKYINANFQNSSFKCGVVNSKEIFDSLRLRIDPPALMNDGVVTMRDVISKMPFKRIGDLDVTVRRPGIFKRIKVENGIPYIKGSEIFLRNPFVRCEHLSKSRTPFIGEMELKNGQILITCAGSVGDVKMITKEYEDKCAIGSQDIIRIDSPVEDDFNTDNLFCKEYLFAYLQLPFVYSYMQSMKYGSVIERIEPFHVESIPVVEPTPELSAKVKNLIRSYMDDSYKAFCLEEEAITLVEKEIEKWNN